MIKSIELKNFKAFKESGPVELKKINVLVGPKSSGKSSFIKALLMLKNTMDNQDAEPAVVLDKRIGNFKSIVYGHDVGERISFNVEFEVNKLETENNKIFASDMPKSGKTLNFLKYIADMLSIHINSPIKNISFTIKQMPDDRVVTEQIRIDLANGKFYEGYMRNESFILKTDVENENLEDLVTPYKFYFKGKWAEAGHNLTEFKPFIEFASCVNEMEEKLSQFTNNIIHIEPFRNQPERTEYVTNLKKLNTVGAKGENTLTTLLSLHKSEEQAENIDIEKLGNDNYSLLIKNKYTGITSNISDVGVGTSQLLPIIVESINSQENSTLIIEEPETHIHPNAQAKLADLFVDCSKNQNKRFIIETHSIFLVTQLEILVAQKKIDPKDIGVYYFMQGKEGTKIVDMKLTENGQFEEEWPSGFFDVHYEWAKSCLALYKQVKL